MVARPGLFADAAHDVRPVAAVAQGLAGLGPLHDPADLDLELAFEHRQAFDRAALVAVGIEHAAGLGVRRRTIAAIRRS